jgi:methanogenic corrinoid protein MtbC1
MIETEIIPRLLLSHLANPEEPGALSPVLSPADVRDFTRIVLEDEFALSLSYVVEVRAKGHAIEAIFLDLLAPTARLLGDMWASDLCSFPDVTIGLSRLQQVLRELSPTFESEAGGPKVQGRILLAAAPGEQHSFGLSMLEAFFRRAGWDVCEGGTQSREELIRLARADWFDAIGLSMSSDVLYESVKEFIPALRAASKNPSVLMMVGGRFFVDHPDHAILVGADVSASDAPDALRRADACLGTDFARR